MRTSNGRRVTYGGAAVTDADTFALPNGQLVRAFIERLDLPEPVVQLHLAEDWARDGLNTYVAGGDGRLMRESGGTEVPAPTGWTLADLAPAEPAGWDEAVTRAGGTPWLPQDGLPSVGESTEEVRGTPPDP